MLAEEVHTGRVLAMQGGFDVIGSSYNRATQALRQPGSAFKPIVYVTALENGFTPATIELDAPFCVWQGAGLGNKCFVNFDRRYAGPQHHALGRRAVAQPDDGPGRVETGMPKITDTARKLGVGDYPNYLSIALGAGDTTVARLVNAYAILANQGRSVKPTTIDYVEDRNGKVIYRTDNRCALMGNCNARRLGRQGDAAAAEPHAPAARPDGGVPDGPHHGRRDQARHRDGAARPQPAAVRQDRNDQRPDQRLVRRRHARHRRRRLSRLRPAAAAGRLCPGRPHRGADLQAMGADRAQGPAEGAVRRAAGNPLGADRPRDRQARVRRVPDHGGPQVVGDLGSVPAADRSRAAAIAAAPAIRTATTAAAGAAGAAATPRSAATAAAPRRGAPRSRRPARLAPPPQPAAGLPTQNAL